MYFPYMYGRGSEVLALRAILEDHRSLRDLVPVIEPVVSDAKRLVKCIEAYGKKDQAAVVFLNPDKYQLADIAERKKWRKEVMAAIQATPSVLPGLRCTSGSTKEQVDSFLSTFAERKVALAYSSPSLSDAEITALSAEKEVRFHLVIDGKLSAGKQGLLPRNKRVDIQDRFKKLARNADYRGQEFFSDRHATYTKDKWAGFGDFACLGNEFSSGGGPAAAVAIHACFKRDGSEMRVEHFVSDDTEMYVGDTSGKFLQAATKLVKAAKARPKQFGTNFALDLFVQHVATDHFPGLGKSKELQISHHMCVMLDVMSGAL